MSALIALFLLSAGMQEGAALPLEYERGVDGPVAVVAADAFPNGETANLRLTVVNRASRPIKLVEFLLAPADCPRSRKPAAVLVTYGAAGGTEAPIPSDDTAIVTIAGEVFRRVLQYQADAGCPTTARPFLTLARVGFCDGSGWEGYATGPEHSEWRGRPWQFGGSCDFTK